MTINTIILANVQHSSIRFLSMSVTDMIEKWNRWSRLLDSEQPAAVGKREGKGVVVWK